MAQTMEVRGLKESRAALLKLNKDVQNEIAGKAMLDALLVVNRAVKAATYRTFSKLTGFTRSGFGVRVYKTLKNHQRIAHIVQYPQSIAGSGADKQLIRKHHMPKTGGRKQAITNVAYWWRFLEFGTDGRKAARTPKARRTARLSRKAMKARNRAQARYDAAPSRGDLQPRPWVRPSLGSTQSSAVDQFRKTLRDRIEATTAFGPRGGT
jgi:hypothetical protein